MASQKSPVTILHEYCIKCREIPRYELITEEKTDKMEMNFTFGIDLFNEYATGSGPNKRVAKHETALALLQLLALKDSDLCEFLKSNGLGENTPIETPYINHNTENYVGKLDALVLINNLPVPVYKQLYEEGMSHNKTFTWTCKLGKLCVEASHRTKKQAKHTASMLMIELLEKELGDDFTNTIPDDFKVDYKEDDLSVERRKVRAHLLGLKTLAQSCSTLETKFSPVVLSKLHRVITEPHLEVITTMQDIRSEMGMSIDQFDSFLNDENLASFGKVCDIVKRFSSETGIDVQFTSPKIIVDDDTGHNATKQGIETERKEPGPHVSGNTNTDKNDTIPFDKLDNSSCLNREPENQKIDPKVHDLGSSIADSTNESNTPSCSNTSNFGENPKSSAGMTEGNSELEPTLNALILVVCKVLIVPPLHFMGLSLTSEESTRKAGILFLRHINSMKSGHARKHIFIENFSSGDEADS